jgi:hypothetical protein
MDKRQHPRFSARFHSSFTSVTVVSGEGNVVDLSLRGCRVQSLTDVQPGACLEVRIAVPEHEFPIQIQQAVVRWSREHQFGLEFVTMAPEEWARLQHTVKQIEMEPYERDKQAAELGESS